ncbi:MAG: hypothetical protein NTV31_10515 [Bacteroidia bacterium]|nr:hypothetical protein [Bacteroidia bacterium]
MKENKEYTGMPLPLWGMSAITALAILVILFLLFNLSDKKPNVRKTKYLKEKTHRYNHNSSLDVYFLGSSITRNALFAFNSLENSIIKNNKRFNFKIVVGNGFSLREFNYKIKEIKTLRPKYLFIESNLACIDIYGNIVLSFRHKLSRIPVELINVGNSFKLNNDFLPDNNIDLINPSSKSNKNNKDSGVRLRIRKINEFFMWNKFFKEAENLGIKIYLLEIPRSYEAEQSIPIILRQQYKSLVNKYSSEFNIGHIDFPNKISYAKYYRGGAHFNKLGADYYSDWLVNELFKRELIK